MASPLAGFELSDPASDPQPAAAAGEERRRAVSDSLVVVVGGQLERAIGTITALAQRWMLDPALLGVYTGLRPYLDQTNRSSLGVSLGAVQEITILRAAGREDEAEHLADVAATTNTVTCLVYAVVLLTLAWWRAPLLSGQSLGAEWTWGLVAMAAMVPLRRYQDFLISVLRAHREFVLTTQLAVLESLASAVVVIGGLWVAGFWGLVASVGLLMSMNIVYLHARHPLRFRWRWDLSTAVRLMVVGLPIWLNTLLFFGVQTIDRGLILWLMPDPDRSLGLYTIALMGTSWSLDLAGRVGLVIYTSFQSTMGRTGDSVTVLRQAAVVTESIVPVLAAGSAVAYLIGPTFLGVLIPKYADGLVALRPLIPGMTLLALAWPARQVLITLNRPGRLAIATLVGLAVIVGAGALGAVRGGLAGVAWGMSLGYAVLFLATDGAAFGAVLGAREWIRHLATIGLTLLIYAAAAVGTAHLPIAIQWGGSWSSWIELALRSTVLAAILLPLLIRWASGHGYAASPRALRAWLRRGDTTRAGGA